MALMNLSGFGNTVVLPYQPEAPMSESLEWLTSVLNSWNGTEHRQRIRKSPRQKFQATMPVVPELSRELNNTLYGGSATRYWAIPLWAEAQQLASVTNGQLLLPVDPTYRDFRAGSLILVWAANNNWEVGTIDTIGVSDITLTAGLSTGYSNVWIMPLRVGRLRSAKRKTNGYTNYVELVLECEDNIDLDPAAPTQYLSYDVHTSELLMPSGNLDETIDANLEIMDFKSGVVDQFFNWNNVRRSRPYGQFMETMEEVWNFRNFLHRRAGKWRSFWMPSFENDMRITSTGSITTSFQFAADGYNEFASDRTHIAIQTMDGTWYFREITVAGSGAFLTATLDTTLGGVEASTIKRISYLGLYRLGTDTVNLKWYGGFAECNVGIVEIAP